MPSKPAHPARQFLPALWRASRGQLTIQSTGASFLPAPHRSVQAVAAWARRTCLSPRRGPPPPAASHPLGGRASQAEERHTDMWTTKSSPAIPTSCWVEGTGRPPISRSPRGRRLLRPPSPNAQVSNAGARGGRTQRYRSVSLLPAPLPPARFAA
jgi:hypothetical protein